MQPAFIPSAFRRFIRPFAAIALLTFALPHGPAIAAEGGDHKATSSTTFIAFDPFYSTVLDGERARGILMVEMGLDIPDQKLRDRIAAALPALRDAYVRMLSAYATTAIRPYRQPDLEDIANRLQAVTDKMIAKKDAARVLMIQTALRVERQ